PETANSPRFLPVTREYQGESGRQATSTPRVGSSKSRRRGPPSTSLASTTFCWLPPADQNLGQRRAHVEGADRLAGEPGLAGRRHQEGRHSAQDGQNQIASDAVAQHEPAAAPVVGDEAEALGA